LGFGVVPLTVGGFQLMGAFRREPLWFDPSFLVMFLTAHLSVGTPNPSCHLASASTFLVSRLITFPSRAVPPAASYSSLSSLFSLSPLVNLSPLTYPSPLHLRHHLVALLVRLFPLPSRPMKQLRPAASPPASRAKSTTSSGHLAHCRGGLPPAQTRTHPHAPAAPPSLAPPSPPSLAPAPLPAAHLSGAYTVTPAHSSGAADAESRPSGMVYTKSALTRHISWKPPWRPLR
jgi:hypothetical protein